jgi:hypothetical protein
MYTLSMPPGWNEAKFGRPNYYTLVRLPMEFTGPPKTAEERDRHLAELDAAKPREIRDALVRAIKRKNPSVTKSEIVGQLAIADAAFGYGLLTPSEIESLRHT